MELKHCIVLESRLIGALLAGDVQPVLAYKNWCKMLILMTIIMDANPASTSSYRGYVRDLLHGMEPIYMIIYQCSTLFQIYYHLTWKWNHMPIPRPQRNWVTQLLPESLSTAVWTDSLLCQKWKRVSWRAHHKTHKSGRSMQFALEK